MPYAHEYLLKPEKGYSSIEVCLINDDNEF